jgi:hypothetical protein
MDWIAVLPCPHGLALGELSLFKGVVHTKIKACQKFPYLQSAKTSAEFIFQADGDTLCRKGPFKLPIMGK